MRIFLTGASGHVGRRVSSLLMKQGSELVLLTRDAAGLGSLAGAPGLTVIEGDPTCPGPWQRAIDGVDVVVHLAGAGIALRCETAQELDELRARRLDSTFQIAMGIEDAERPPQRLVVLTSLLGAPGVNGTSPHSELIATWEDQARLASAHGTQVVLIRPGVMLGPDVGWSDLSTGGVGEAHRFDWIHEDDLAAAIAAAALGALSGEVDAIADTPLSCASLENIRKRFVKSVSEPNDSGPTGELRAFIERPHAIDRSRSLSALGHPLRHSDPEESFGVERGSTPASPSPPSRPAQVVEDPAPRRLAVLPCEGFLLEDGALRPDAAEAVGRLHAAGLLALIATSRGGYLSIGLARQLGVVAPVIAADGSVIVDPRKDEAIRTEVLAAEQVAGIVMAIRTTEPQAVVVVERGIHVSTDLQEGIPEDLSKLVTINERTDLPGLLSRPATRLLICAPARRLERALKAVRETWWRQRLIAIHEHAPGTVAITAPSADRGVALQRVESALGVPRRSSFVVGATPMDAGMLEFAGTGYVIADEDQARHAGSATALATSDPVDVADTLVRAHLSARMRDSTPRG